jgi:hypothetical protein
VSVTSKSPVRVAQQALAVGTNAFSLYAHRYSPKLYSQPQLFACLVLKTFFKTDYRGIAQQLRDLSDLRRVAHPAVFACAEMADNKCHAPVSGTQRETGPLRLRDRDCL